MATDSRGHQRDARQTRLVLWPGVLSSAFGLLGLLTVLSFPTLAIVLGVLAIVIAALGRRRVAVTAGDAGPVRPRRLIDLGLALGIAAVAASVAVVVATTV